MVSARRKPWDSPSKTISRQGDAVLGQPVGEPLGLVGGHDRIVRALEQQHRPDTRSGWWIGDRAR